MRDKPEILAPAGSPESLEAAVRAGADAVYLGGRLFSARANAQNFDDEALRAAVAYCHTRGVQVHLAVNTTLFDRELEDALDCIRYACSLPVDAVILQDAGLLWLARRCCPGLVLHASTQMSLHTPAGVRAAKEAGFRRVVLSREMSLEEIRACPLEAVELEAFVHGALCMSVSGQCYFSAMLGSRSGNRGQCAQPCRLPFAAPGGTGHDLSLKDLSMITRLDELSDAGVSSVKIEGRMKRPEYVAAAVRACRLAADGEGIPPDLLQNLGAVFSRSGFTTGYPDAALGREMFGVRSKEDVASATNAVLADLRSLYHQEYAHIPVNLMLSVQAGTPTVLEASDAEGHMVRVSGEPPEPARSRPLDPDRCREQLQKTGGTPFTPGETTLRLGEGLSVPVSLLNRLRREALEELAAVRSRREPVPFTSCRIPPSNVHRASQEPRLRARFADASQIPENAVQCELVYLPCTTSLETLRRLQQNGLRLALELPRGMFGLETAVRTRLNAAKEAGIQDVWAGNLGAAQLAKEMGFTVHGGFSLNITNSAAIQWYTEFGLADTELSFELTLAQAVSLGGALPRGLLLYGRLPLMLTRNCPIANAPGGCQGCDTTQAITDRKGIAFPVQCSGACSEVLNSVPLDLSDRLREVKNQDFGVLRFTTESRPEAFSVLERYRTGGPPAEHHTRGLYYRGIL